MGSEMCIRDRDLLVPNSMLPGDLQDSSQTSFMESVQAPVRRGCALPCFAGINGSGEDDTFVQAYSKGANT